MDYRDFYPVPVRTATFDENVDCRENCRAACCR